VANLTNRSLLARVNAAPFAALGHIRCIPHRGSPQLAGAVTSEITQNINSPRTGGIRVRQQFQMLGFNLAGFLCLVLAVLKRTIQGQWSWWRVLLPFRVVVGHNALYITVGFA
jgi:hypothetical protein